MLLITLLIFELFASLEYRLGIGETLSLPLKKDDSIVFEKKGVLSFVDQGESIIFSGKKRGQTEVKIGGKKIKFIVVDQKSRQTLKSLTEWLEGKRGPELMPTTDRVIVGGRLLRLKDLKSLEDDRFSEVEWENRMQVSSALASEINSYVTGLLKSNNLQGGQLSFTPQWKMGISSEHRSQISQYKTILKLYGIKTLIDTKSFSQKPMIKIQVYIAHIKKSFLREWGVQWPSQFSASLIPQGAVNWDAFQVSLKALETSGHGQLLASPTLVTQSGSTGEFHSGGEFPIRTSTQFNNNVQWKQYGLFLKAQPTVNALQHMKMNIHLRLSTLDQSLSSEGVPALMQSQVKTEINMKKLTPILLSGFFQKDQGDNRSGLPWLQQIPLLRPLFSNGQIHNNELELVFILVPKLISQETDWEQ